MYTTGRATLAADNTPSLIPFRAIFLTNLSFKIYGNDQNLELTNYLFSGTNIKRDYANSDIMNLFSNVRYVGNSNANYISVNNKSIINYYY